MTGSPRPVLHIHEVPKHPKKRTRRPRVDVSPLASLKGALTVAGDIRSDIQFQNDVNALLAAVSRLSSASQSGEVVRMPGAEQGIAQAGQLGELGFEALDRSSVVTPPVAPNRRRRLMT